MDTVPVTHRLMFALDVPLSFFSLTVNVPLSFLLQLEIDNRVKSPMLSILILLSVNSSSPSLHQDTFMGGFPVNGTFTAAD